MGSLKIQLAEQNFHKHLRKAQSLVKQSNLLALAMEEKNDLDWKSIIFGMKKGFLKFALNSTTDTLPTNVNLVQWGKKS